jgi:hypothetical protein
MSEIENVKRAKEQLSMMNFDLLLSFKFFKVLFLHTKNEKDNSPTSP